MTAGKTVPIKSFSTTQKWHAWLLKNHASQQGIELRLFKKDSGIKSITYAEAVDEALCFGWIDGIKKKYDEKSWIQKFTPRRPKSLWSKTNRENIARLIKEKRMQPAGLKEVEAAKKDGRWEAAYDSPKNMEVPADFLKELKKNKKAYEFFKTLNKSNIYAIAWRLQTAKKPETREKRLKILIEMMKDNKKIH
jgi:uncharacterized protein YdeI (YjbR/CyaY-like superfamily)